MLDNKVILITGASRGIGRAVAKAFAAQNAKLILLSRTMQDLETLSDEIVLAGKPKPTLYPFNLCSATLTDYDDLRRYISNVIGRLDGLIHCAGILGNLTPLEHYDIQTWYQVLQVNLNSAFILTQSTLPLLKQAASGKIIFTLNNVGLESKANWGAYAVANAGIKSMLQMLASECANITRIKVNAVMPDKVQTALRKQAYPAEKQDTLVTPAQVAAHYTYLMNDICEANGQVILASHQDAANLIF